MENKVSTTLSPVVYDRLIQKCLKEGMLKSVAIRTMIVECLFTEEEISAGVHLK